MPQEAVVVGAVDAQHEQPRAYQHRREGGVPECDTAGQTMRHQDFHGLHSEAEQLRAQDCPADHQEIGKGDPTHEAGQGACSVLGGVVRTGGSLQCHGAMTEPAGWATAEGTGTAGTSPIS